MAKIFVLDEDTIEAEMEIPDERFIFIRTKSGRVYHMDLTDENMWLAQNNLENLGRRHREILFDSLRK